MLTMWQKTTNFEFWTNKNKNEIIYNKKKNEAKNKFFLTKKKKS